MPKAMVFGKKESLTASMIEEASILIDEIEALGGMTKAVESGMPKLKIEEAAAKKQARIDRGEEVIVGVNKYRMDVQDDLDVLSIDNTVVRDQQIKRLENIRATRDQAACDAALSALSEGAKNGTGNLLELSVNAARARATVGEISDAMEEAFGRYKAQIHSISGIYSSEAMEDKDFIQIIDLEDRSTGEALGTRVEVRIPIIDLQLKQIQKHVVLAELPPKWYHCLVY